MINNKGNFRIVEKYDRMASQMSINTAPYTVKPSKKALLNETFGAVDVAECIKTDQLQLFK